MPADLLPGLLQHCDLTRVKILGNSISVRILALDVQHLQCKYGTIAAHILSHCRLFPLVGYRFKLKSTVSFPEFVHSHSSICRKLPCFLHFSLVSGNDITHFSSGRIKYCVYALCWLIRQITHNQSVKYPQFHVAIIIFAFRHFPLRRVTGKRMVCGDRGPLRRQSSSFSSARHSRGVRPQVQRRTFAR